MRFAAKDGSTVHLSYCSNVHAAESAHGVVEQLARYAGPVRQAADVPVLGLGLWLSADAACAFTLEGGLRDALREELRRQQLEVVTLNGFPYGGFHDPVVKHSVYRPDWTTPQRADHTLRLARLLAWLLPDDVADGTISTLPLGYREPWGQAQQDEALRRLGQVAEGLADLERRSGKRIRLALEPEPGCVLETTEQVSDLLASLGRPEVQACLDAAHLAVQWEDPLGAVQALAARSGIAKAQLATALHVDDPRADRGLLQAHDEPRYLHQVRERSGGGTDDLPEALAGALAGAGPWRVHVHLPLHADPAHTTAAELEQVLSALVGGDVPLTHSLEIETYTWSVLPDEHRPQGDDALVAGIAQELGWARQRLRDLGLTELSR